MAIKKNVLIKIHFVIVILAMLLLNAVCIYAEESLSVNQKAPGFTLKTLDGKKTIKSKDIFLEKKLTVLIFWDSYCPDCLKAVADCQKFYQYSQEQKLDIGIYSINFDNEKLAMARSFVKGAGIKFPVLSDPQGLTVSKYKAKAYDFSFFIIDNNGIINYTCYDHPPDVADVIKESVLKLLKDRLKSSSPAPDFALKTWDNDKTIQAVELFSQKPLTIMIFWNSKCKESLKAIVEYQKLYGKILELGIGFLSVNFDNNIDSVMSFAKEKGISFPIFYDVDKIGAELYKVEDCCFGVFMLDNEGIVKIASYENLIKINEIEDELEKLRQKNEKK